MLEPSTEPLDLDLFLLPDATLILLAALIEPLRAANRVAGKPLYRWRLVSTDGAPVTTTSGISIPVDDAYSPDKGDVPLVVVASYNWQNSVTPALVRQLGAARRHRPMIIGVESGVWLMARAGLLDGHRAAAHWEDYEEFAAAYPNISLSEERFVVDGRRITTGGALPTVDLMLEIIKQRQGYSMALEVSRLFIYEPVTTSAAPAIVPSTSGLRQLDGRVSNAVTIMEQTLHAPLNLEQLAKRVGVTSRHLQTLFRACLGVPPHVHYLALRLYAARRQVIETRLPFADIAPACGFSSAAAFSRRYREQYGESPTETRRNRAGRSMAGVKERKRKGRIVAE